MPHGHCTLPADDAGRILDRLAGLEQVIPAEAVRQALQATGRTNQRRCKLTHEVVCWVVLAMGLLTELPIRQVFKHARRLRFGEESPHRSSLCVARQRLGIAPMRRLFEQTVRPLARPETPGAFYGGFRLMGIDGVVFDVPDSDVNAAAFGRPSAGPRATELSPRSASSVWSSWGLMPRSPSSCVPSPMASRGWSAPCSAIWNPRCSCCGIAASSAMACGKR